MIALVLVVALAAEGLPPPPAPFDAPAPLTPYVEPDDEPPVLKPLPPIDSPDGPPVVAPKTAPSVAGLDPLAVGFLQWLVPCATVAIALPCSAIAAYFCPVFVCVPCVLPAANGYLVTYIGDRFGRDRAPAIWPVIVSYASAAAGSVALFVLYFVAAPAFSNGDLQNPLLLAGFAGSMLVLASATIAVPVSYALSSEPKHAGDDGSEVPGWFEPKHPEPIRKKPKGEPPDAPPRLAAMRF